MFSKFYELMLVFAILNQQVFLSMGKVSPKAVAGGGSADGQCWLPWQTRAYKAFPYVQRQSGFWAFLDSLWDLFSGEPPCKSNEEFSWTPPGCYEPTPQNYYCYGPLCVMDKCEGAFPQRCKLPALCAFGAAALALVNPFLAVAVGIICLTINFMCTVDSYSCGMLNVVSLFI
jgi:hypothetical protein